MIFSLYVKVVEGTSCLEGILRKLSKKCEIKMDCKLEKNEYLQVLQKLQETHVEGSSCKYARSSGDY